MAIGNPTNILNGFSVINDATSDTAAVTLTAGRWYVIAVAGYTAAGGQAISSVQHDPTGTPLSFTKLTGAAQIWGARAVEIWAVRPTSTTANAVIRITWPSSVSIDSWIMDEFATGVDDADFDVQVVASTATGVTASATTMGSFGGSDNATYYVVAIGTGTSHPQENVAPGESRTELAENQQDAGECRILMHTSYQNPHGSDTSLNSSWTTTSDYGAIGVEVRSGVPAVPPGHGFGGGGFSAWGEVPWGEIEPQVAGAQEITSAGAIATAETFGTAVVDRPHVDPSAIASAEAFGTLSVDLTLNPSGIASAEAFGTLSVDLTLNPSAIATAEAFGTPVVDRPHVDPSGIASGEAFGTLTIVLHVNPSAIASAEAFGTAEVLIPVFVDPSSIASAEAFGTTVVDRPHVDPSAIASAEAFGTTVVDRPHVDPSAIASAEAFGTTFVGEVTQITGTGAIASAEAFGSPVVDRPHVDPSSIASAEVFGTTIVDRPQIDPSGIASAEAFGTIVLALTVNPSGIPSAEAFGTLSADLTINPSGIASAEAFGTVVIVLHVDTVGVTSAEAFGTPVVDRPHVDPSGIPSAEAFGTAEVAEFTEQEIFVVAIASAEAFGVTEVNYALYEAYHRHVLTKLSELENRRTASGAGPDTESGSVAENNRIAAFFVEDKKSIKL